jgi:hypothetical protein
VSSRCSRETSIRYRAHRFHHLAYAMPVVLAVVYWEGEIAFALAAVIMGALFVTCAVAFRAHGRSCARCLVCVPAATAYRHRRWLHVYHHPAHVPGLLVGTALGAAGVFLPRMEYMLVVGWAVNAMYWAVEDIHYRARIWCPRCADSTRV